MNNCEYLNILWFKALRFCRNYNCSVFHWNNYSYWLGFSSIFSSLMRKYWLSTSIYVIQHSGYGIKLLEKVERIWRLYITTTWFELISTKRKRLQYVLYSSYGIWNQFPFHVSWTNKRKTCDVLSRIWNINFRRSLNMEIILWQCLINYTC